jgi:GDPmannose 4,6-dehydratase
MKRALITGITGQDGSYLAEHLLSQDYEVYGLVRYNDRPRATAMQHLLKDVRLIDGDLLDRATLLSALNQAEPDEVYNLAEISYVPTSWEHAERSGEITGLGVLRILEAIRTYSDLTGSRNPGPGQIRFYQASSSEIFGHAEETPQNEHTALRPCTPYGAAKAYGHYLVQTYRESYRMYAVSGIEFNHESPRSSPTFLARKVSQGAARIKLGHQKQLRLGRLSGSRDWGFAGDYVRAMHMMLAQEEPRDFVLGTGLTHTVEQLVELAFRIVGLDWHEHVVCDTSVIRIVEADNLRADPSRAAEELGWRAGTSFADLVTMMVEADLALAHAEDDSPV